jgi:phosphoribosylformimino-5-aminoimidazole carboxamide ribonucleotide (ProFAR) isomerase
VPVQTGGGLRTVMHAERAFAAGAYEIILGTLMVEDERLARNIDDLALLKRSVSPAVDSCIVGSALYNGTLDLPAAIAAVS